MLPRSQALEFREQRPEPEPVQRLAASAAALPRFAWLRVEPSAYPELKRLAVVGALTLAARLTLVLGVPELEGDAYGHLKLARAFLRDPTNLHVHWVWLPGWHLVLGLGLLLGAGHTSVRLVNAALQALGPCLLYLLGRSLPAQPQRSAHLLGYHAALFYSLAPLPLLLGSSALAETVFALCMLGAALALSKERGGTAGYLLAVGSLLRYEAWGVVALLGLKLIKKPRWNSSGKAFAIAAVTIVAWLLARHAARLPWLSFVSGTTSFVERYRSSGQQRLCASALALTLLPLAALGPAILIAARGLRWIRQSMAAVPLGLSSVLIASALGGGLLALPRYFSALTPFACLAIAAGVGAIHERSGNEARWIRIIAVSIALTTGVHVVFALAR